MMNPDIEQSLIQSSNWLLHGDGSSKLRAVLLAECPALTSAYVVGCIPEQAEDIYTVIVDGNTIIIAEIPREEAYREAGLQLPPTTVERFDAKQFVAKLGSSAKLMRRKIAVARSIAAKEQQRQ